jgi:hypothetical protein
MELKGGDLKGGQLIGQVDFLENPLVWLDASDLNTISLNGNNVSAWNDKSGNNNHVSQATASLQPVNGVNLLAGKNTINFDGTDFLVGSPVAVTSDLTIFIALKDWLSPVFNTIISNCGPGESEEANCTYFINISSVTRKIDILWEYGSGNNEIVTTNNVVPTGPVLLIFSRNNSSKNANVRINITDDDLSYSNNPTGGETGLFYVGSNIISSSHYIGDLAEIIMYDSLLSAANKTKVETYLKNKWGI